MRLDIAQTIDIGDIVYNCFKEPLKVVQKIEVYNSFSKLDRIEFSVIGSVESVYNYTDLYLKDMVEESDEETSWVYWASCNQDILVDADIDLIRTVYVAAFANGYEYKRNLRFQEMMQK